MLLPYVTAFRDSFNLIGNIICSEKVDFWPIDPIPGVGWGGGVCWQNICYNVAAFVIPFNLICNMTMFWKVEFWPLGSGGWGLQAKYLLPCCYIFWFHLIWYATWPPCSEKVELWPIDLIPRVGVWESAGKIFATTFLGTMLLHSWFSLIWYATWPCSEKVQFWPIDPIPRVRGGGGEGRKHLVPCCCNCNSLKFDMQHDHVQKDLISTTCSRQFRRLYSAQNKLLCQLQVLSSCSVDQIIN